MPDKFSQSLAPGLGRVGVIQTLQMKSLAINQFKNCMRDGMRKCVTPGFCVVLSTGGLNKDFNKLAIQDLLG
jgi:hypothetical protein